jgi:hypothetical protein
MKIDIPRAGKRRDRRVVLLTGGRDFDDENWLFELLDTALQQCEQMGVRMVLLQGGAAGADRIGRAWADYQDGSVDLITVKADWKKYEKPGQKNPAGPIRNQVMIDRYDPDYYIAMPGQRGTNDMVKRCKLAEIPGADFRPPRA